MPSWGYKAGTAGASRVETQRILDTYGFLWRTMYSKAGELIPNVQWVVPITDRLFVYYYERGAYTFLGGYRIIPPGVSTRTRANGDAARALVRLDPQTDAQLIQELKDNKYRPDPYLGCYTGFEVMPLKGIRPPAKIPPFTGHTALCRFSPGDIFIDKN